MTNKDKIYHFIAGLAVAVVIGYISAFVGLCIAIVVAMAKEMYDYTAVGHTSDGMDFVATIVGGLVGYVTVIEVLK